MCKGLKMCKKIVIILVLVPLSLNSLVPLERFDVLCIRIVCTRCRLLTFGSSVRMSAFQCVCTICVLQSLLFKPYQQCHHISVMICWPCLDFTPNLLWVLPFFIRSLYYVKADYKSNPCPSGCNNFDNPRLRSFFKALPLSCIC